jgi:hypothetical protein
MTVRPPRYLSGLRPADDPQNALDYEIAQEKASTLGRLGRRLEAALAELAAFDAEHASTMPGSPEQRATRRGLVDAAGTALWHFIVQREVLGLRDAARVLVDYRVPNEVRDRTGAFPTMPLAGRRRRV